jgi:hypothetical protein
MRTVIAALALAIPLAGCDAQTNRLLIAATPIVSALVGAQASPKSQKPRKPRRPVTKD